MSLEDEFGSEFGRKGVNSDSNLMKVRIHRVKEFLTNLLAQLEGDFHSYESLFNDTIDSTRYIFSVRKNATIVETGLVAFWLNLQQRGLQALSITELISITREKLGRQVSAGRILHLISRVKSRRGGFKSLKKLKKLLSKLYLQLLRGKIKNTLSKKVKHPSKYTILMEKEIEKAINSLKENEIAIMGQSRKVIGAIVFYILDKVVSNKLNVNPVFSAKEIADLLGVSQYTILREYKKFIDLLGKNGQVI